MAVVAAALSGSAAASAQAGAAEEREARARFAAGQSAYEAGRFEDALSDFQHAHRLSGRVELLYNVGLAADRLRQDDVALDAYRAFADARPDHPRAEWVRQRVEALEASGSAGEPSTGEAAPATTGGTNVGAWVLGAVSVAAVVTGATLLGLALSDRNAIESMSEPQPWPELEGRVDAVPRRSGVGIALLGLGAASALAALLWGILGRENAPVRAAIGPGFLTLDGRF